MWSCELIDKLDTLVRHHNAYIRNFRNIGMSLDATMKVYEIRVDSVFNDVRRLGYGIASTTCMFQCSIIIFVDENNCDLNYNNLMDYLFFV